MRLQLLIWPYFCVGKGQGSAGILIEMTKSLQGPPWNNGNSNRTPVDRTRLRLSTHIYSMMLCHSRFTAIEIVSFSVTFKVEMYNNYMSLLCLQSVLITTNVVSSNSVQVRCTRYNIMWYNLSVASGRSVVFSEYSGFLHQ